MCGGFVAFFVKKGSLTNVIVKLIAAVKNEGPSADVNVTYSLARRFVHKA